MSNTFICTCGRAKSSRIRFILVGCQCGRVWFKVDSRWKERIDAYVKKQDYSIQSTSKI